MKQDLNESLHSVGSERAESISSLAVKHMLDCSWSAGECSATTVGICSNNVLHQDSSVHRSNDDKSDVSDSCCVGVTLPGIAPCFNHCMASDETRSTSSFPWTIGLHNSRNKTSSRSKYRGDSVESRTIYSTTLNTNVSSVSTPTRSLHATKLSACESDSTRVTETCGKPASGDHQIFGPVTRLLVKKSPPLSAIQRSAKYFISSPHTAPFSGCSDANTRNMIDGGSLREPQSQSSSNPSSCSALPACIMSDRQQAYTTQFISQFHTSDKPLFVSCVAHKTLHKTVSVPSTCLPKIILNLTPNKRSISGVCRLCIPSNNNHTRISSTKARTATQLRPQFCQCQTLSLNTSSCCAQLNSVFSSAIKNDDVRAHSIGSVAYYKSDLHFSDCNSDRNHLSSSLDSVEIFPLVDKGKHLLGCFQCTDDSKMTSIHKPDTLFSASLLSKTSENKYLTSLKSNDVDRHYSKRTTKGEFISKIDDVEISRRICWTETKARIDSALDWLCSELVKSRNIIRLHDVLALRNIKCM